MAKNPEQDFDGLENQGEGNKAAARDYDRRATEHAKSGKAGRAAREAAKAIEGREGGELKKAEDVGKQHIAEEDPELRR